jgi:hypothetical protein
MKAISVIWNMFMDCPVRLRRDIIATMKIIYFGLPVFLLL